jgi:TRAP-type C4-dicarboxylate transport system permease large subunit
MIVIVRLVAFLAAGLVAVAGTLGNAGADHPPTEKLAVFGYHPTGSTGTLFLLRIVIGVVASLFVAAHRSASRAAEAQRAFVNRGRDTRLEHQRRSDTRNGLQRR